MDRYTKQEIVNNFINLKLLQFRSTEWEIVHNTISCVKIDIYLC